MQSARECLCYHHLQKLSTFIANVIKVCRAIYKVFYSLRNGLRIDVNKGI